VGKRLKPAGAVKVEQAYEEIQQKKLAGSEGGEKVDEEGGLVTCSRDNGLCEGGGDEEAQSPTRDPKGGGKSLKGNRRALGRELSCF